MPDELLQLDPLPEVIERLTISQALRFFIRVYWGEKKMYRNTRSFIRYIMAFFNDAAHPERAPGWIDRIGRGDMTALMQALAAGAVPGQLQPLGASGRNKVLTILRLMYRLLEECRDDGWAYGHNWERLALPRRDPAKRVRKVREPKDPRFFSPWHFRIWIRLAKGRGDFDLANAIRLGVWFRLAPIDLLELNDDEIFDADMQILVYRRHTKNERNPQGEIQSIHMTEKQWGLLQTMRRFRRPGDKRIVNKRNLRRRLRRLRDDFTKLGHSDFTLRHLRRSWSGHAHNKEVDIDTIAAGLGNTPKTARAFYVPSSTPRLRAVEAELAADFDG